jgi:lactoylglutathione lyase
MYRAVTSNPCRLIISSWKASKMMTRPTSNIVPSFIGGVKHVSSKKYVSSSSSTTTTTTESTSSSSSTEGNNSKTNESTTITDRPFKILGIQQIAIGHDNRTSLNHLWYNIFGLQPIQQNIRIETENVCEDIVRDMNDIEIDLMTPLDVTKSPKVHVPPLNHIGLWVDQLPIAVEWMTQQGVRFTPGGIRTGAAGYDVTFIHPKSNDTFPICGNGILIELVQAPDHIIERYNQKMKTK